MFLRDDLIVEVAKRKSDNVEKIRAVRGMHHGFKPEVLAQIADCVRRGLEAPLDDIERPSQEAMPSQLNLLGQFLSPALSSICRNANVATSLAGTATDVRDLIAYRLGFSAADNDEPPLLASGWRAELGRAFDRGTAGRQNVDSHRRPAERASAGVRLGRRRRHADRRGIGHATHERSFCR